MKFEKSLKTEQIGGNRERLLSLEKEGKYVFHGSSDAIDVLKPRQAFNQNKETNKMEKDGKPAVFATTYVDVAIFRALIGTKDVVGKSESQFGVYEDGLHFSVTKNLLESAKRKIGKVYVLDKQNFQNFKGMQCRSEELNVPLEAIEVSADDLPQDIDIINQ